MASAQKKKTEDSRQKAYKTACLILLGAIIVVGALLAEAKLQPILCPTGKSLIKEGITPYMKKNSIRGTVNIRNDATVDLSSVLGDGMTSDIAVATTGSAFVIDNNKMYVSGSTGVKYADLAETTNYFKVYKDLKKNKQYVYYTNTEPGQEYLTDYENWAAIDAPKNQIDNFPEALGGCLYDMKDMKMTKYPDDKGYTVTGQMDQEALAVLVRYMVQVDTKNTCLMNGIELTKKSAQKVKLTFDGDRNMKSVSIDITNARAGSTIKINDLHIDFTTEENKQTLSIPSLLTKATLDSDFDIPVQEDDIANDIDKGQASADPNGYLKTLGTLGLRFNEKDIKSLDDAKNIVTDTDGMTGIESTDSISMSSSEMEKDSGSKVYFYTDQSTGDITQLGFDTSYAKHDKLPVKIAGMAPGETATTAIQILGDPSNRTTGNGIDTLTYRTGDGKYLITLTFYQGDSLTDAGLQKINIRKLEGTSATD